MGELSGGDVVGAAISLGLFGMLAMIAMPWEWKTVQGWLIVSFAIIPGVILVAALAASSPLMIVGLAFLLGIAATQKK